MKLREKFEKETGFTAMAYRQDYGGQKPYEDGFADEYVEWLESKVENLSLCGVSNSLVADIRNKLSSPKNLVAMLKESPLLHHPNVKIHEMIRKEMEQTLKNIEYLSNL